MAFPRLPAPMLLASFILLLCWTTSSAESHDPTSAALSPPYRVRRALPFLTRERVEASLTFVKEVTEDNVDTNDLSGVLKWLAKFARLAPSTAALVYSWAFIRQEDDQKELFAEVNRKLDSLSIQISNLATDVEWFNYASVYSQDEVRLLNAWKTFNEFRENSELVDSEEAKLRLAEVFTSYYENTATEASVANLYLYLTVSSTSLSGNLNELLKKKFKCSIAEIGKYNLYFSSLLWKGMVLNQVYWNLIGFNSSGKEAEHTQMFKNVYRAQISAVEFCLDNYKQYMIKDVEEIIKANSCDNKTDIAVQVKNKLDKKYNWYNWVVLVYNSSLDKDYNLFNLTKISTGKVTFAVGYTLKGDETQRVNLKRLVYLCFEDDQCEGGPLKLPECYSTFLFPYLTDNVKVTQPSAKCKWLNSAIVKYLFKVLFVCNNNPCKNGGRCRRLLDSNEYLCECPDDYYGDTCETRMDFSKPPMINTHRPVPGITTIDTKLKMMDSKLDKILETTKGRCSGDTLEKKLEEILETIRGRCSGDTLEKKLEEILETIRGRCSGDTLEKKPEEILETTRGRGSGDTLEKKLEEILETKQPKSDDL